MLSTPHYGLRGKQKYHEKSKSTKRMRHCNEKEDFKQKKEKPHKKLDLLKIPISVKPYSCEACGAGTAVSSENTQQSYPMWPMISLRQQSSHSVVPARKQWLLFTTVNSNPHVTLQNHVSSCAQAIPRWPRMMTAYIFCHLPRYHSDYAGVTRQCSAVSQPWNRRLFCTCTCNCLWAPLPLQ